jgi:hypothetical protein
MGSTGDRAASLMLGEREACAWGQAASSVSCGLPLPTNSINHEVTTRTTLEAAPTIGARAGSSINLPTDAYYAFLGGVFTKPRLLARIGTIGH